MADLCDPIPGASPVGQPARYEPIYQRLEGEIGKLGAPGADPVDWAAVARDAEDVLTRLSKDLLVMCWLVRARFHREGQAGLAAGLGQLRGFIATWWETAQPPVARPRARRQTLAWLAEGLAPLVAREAAAHALVAALAVDLAGRLEDGGACLAPLLRALAPTTEPQAAVAAQAAQAPAASGPIRSRGEAVARLREVSAWFRQSEPHSPVAFLVDRAAGWAEKDFPSLMTEILANHQPAQSELWQVLGLRPPEATSP